MNIDESILSKLTDEQKKKVEAAQTPEELLALAKEARYELSREQLEAVSGGEGINWCRIHGCSDVCTYHGACMKVCNKYNE